MYLDVTGDLWWSLVISWWLATLDGISGAQRAASANVESWSFSHCESPKKHTKIIKWDTHTHMHYLLNSCVNIMNICVNMMMGSGSGRMGCILPVWPSFQWKIAGTDLSNPRNPNMKYPSRFSIAPWQGPPMNMNRSGFFSIRLIVSKWITMSWGYLKKNPNYNSAGFRLGLLSAKNHPD